MPDTKKNLHGPTLPRISRKRCSFGEEGSLHQVEFQVSNAACATKPGNIESMPGPLTNPQRKFLRGLAHNAPPTMHLGKHGLTPNFLKSFELALTSHEVLKLRFANLQDERQELSSEIVTATGAILVSMVGHTAVYYRPNPDPEKRKVVLPRSTRSQFDATI